MFETWMDIDGYPAGQDIEQPGLSNVPTMKMPNA
jgi:hypothetical protein